MKVFLIDDDIIYRRIASKMWELIDSSVETIACENGAIGLLDLECERDSNQPISVLLDINMPVLNGWDFLRELEKKNFYQLPDLHIYLVSSSTDERDILKSREFPFIKAFIHKPLTKENIEMIINHVQDHPDKQS
ncbi:response regulator [Leeuwenhoekiella polynyae]|uniref:CheY-like chemotaxis protein n=1 Tax=Leeuwenhoekiella polynyae TaxID=1550906 RepID=A0A4Q0NT79_9FLAO|nr:response regulator [Leeuwenhoekiella polynyae]RXG13018.1 CheY-like chemotaxis protein [Leeuwenhoekiella polynyae]